MLPESQPLANVKHENFCQNIAMGLRNDAAYVNAGYECKTKKVAHSGANKLKQRTDVCNRIEWLLYQNNKLNELTRERVLEQYRRIAYPSVVDFCEFDEDGVRLKNSKDIRPDRVAAIKTIKSSVRTVKNRGNEEKIVDSELTLHNQIKALERIENLIGLHTDIGKIRTGLLKYGKDIHIDKDSGNWDIVDLENLD